MKFSEELLIRYGEIFLKSDFVFNRFENKLTENIALALKRAGINFKIRKERGRIFVLAERKAIEELQKVFGIVSISPVWRLETVELKEIKKFCQKKYENFLSKKETFAVRARRVGKHDFSSQELEREIGKIIQGKADLNNPQKEIFLEVREKNTYIFTEIFPGLAGLPVSVSGKIVSFLSGGIDSSLASFLMMKRGCQIVFLHFHSFPLTSKKSIEKCLEIVKKLNDYQFQSKLILMPFQKIQRQFKTKAPSKYLVLFYRRSMIRIGQRVAKLEKASALLTGESLAQVASQTLSNISAINQEAKIPIFRPLISSDKKEIIDQAKKIGTYEISILPQEDCCTLFTPKHPATQADSKILKTIEAKIKIKKLENLILKEREEIII